MCMRVIKKADPGFETSQGVNKVEWTRGCEGTGEGLWMQLETCGIVALG